MYEMLSRLLVEEFGLDEEQVRPDATARQLELDSLSLAELAVIVTESTGVRLEDVEVSPDSTLGEMAEVFDRARPPATDSTGATPPASPCADRAATTAAAPASVPSLDQALLVTPAQS
ncbi:acyl carrier protein [Streptomyces sp. NPDC060184]|uniref:acyl carrier protein n=1 Tax=Streptomyces sp. NPDC060184 TaxID=3347064 RepID=UPI00365FE073